MIVVANDKVLASVQGLEDRFDRRGAEEEVADDVHLVVFADLRVPSRGHFLILVAEQEVWQMNMLNAVTGKIEPVSFHDKIISRL